MRKDILSQICDQLNLALRIIYFIHATINIIHRYKIKVKCMTFILMIPGNVLCVAMGSKTHENGPGSGLYGVNK